MEAYSLDLRERVVRACDQRRSTRREIAEWFGVSERWSAACCGGGGGGPVIYRSPR